MERYDKLVDYIRKLESVVIAFSGGVDSTLVLKAAKDALGDNAVALTIHAPFHLNWEIEEAKEIAQKLGVRHEIIEFSDIMPEIIDNPSDRCYLCKKKVFGEIKDFAETEGIRYVLDGTNADDDKDYRPGLKALKELDILSPLQSVKITKSEVRAISKNLQLDTWEKPAYACILSRIEYGQRIKEDDLQKIEDAETYLIDMGFATVRVRLHGQLARIEVAEQDLDKLLTPDTYKKVNSKLKSLGFSYVTVDLEGYRMGSQNEVL
ncbi:ATP-dependent sacrificial sulfur transferase LarE [Proteinivorax hydrogeniformans]|uniref:ATP-dependent sacrificial sulfur transferase LarE n=1 Tax=Proteinivorax hydrogeniformans TaxID=1826727 RepID=A0AAU8HT70_9FIRM